MSFPLYILFLLFAGAHINAASQTNKVWTPETYPSLKDAHACGTDFYSHLCDPNDLLTELGKERVHSLIEKIQTEVEVKNCPNAKYEIAIALAHEVNGNYLLQQGGKKKGIENFAIDLHNRWGVGDARCQTGIVLFLSKVERQMFWTTGAGVKDTLKDDHLDEIIGRMKDKLRQKDFDGALLQALTDIERVLIHGYVTTWSWADFLPYIGIGIFIIFVAVNGYYQKQKEAEYRDARRRLTEMEKRSAENLENNFEIESCMICFEDFPAPGPERDEMARLLRCGHRFCKGCIGSWEEQGHDTCPLCRKNLYGDNNDQRPPGPPPGGNDNNDGGDDESRPFAPRTSSFQDSWQGCSIGSSQYGSYRSALRGHRLRRLNRIHPSFITMALINRWMAPGYSGGYTSDTHFTNANPYRPPPARRSGGRIGGNFSSSGFSGGSRSGGSGRGGGW